MEETLFIVKVTNTISLKKEIFLQKDNAFLESYNGEVGED